MGGSAAFGVVLKIGDGATPTETFTTFADVVNISGINFTQDFAETTNMGSTNAFKEYVSTTKDLGDLTLDMNFIADNSQQVSVIQTKAEANPQVLTNYQLAFNDTSSSTLTVAAFVGSYNINHPLSGKAELTITLKCSGSPTWA